MDTNVLRTSVDDLYELVQSKKRISVEQAAKLLSLPPSVVHSLVDFLVEEKIFGIEYRFTTPYIYLSQKKENANLQDYGAEDLITKEQFFEKAQRRSIPLERVHALWSKYLEENIAKIKETFYQKSYRKNIPKEQIDTLWNKYLSHIK